MSAMDEASAGDSSLAKQCLALCLTLASQGRTFSLSLTAGSSFIFSMESKGVAIPAEKVKKKSSPSTLRRNARRRDIFLRRKLESLVLPVHLHRYLLQKGSREDLSNVISVSKHGLKYHMESFTKQCHQVPQLCILVHLGFRIQLPVLFPVVNALILSLVGPH